MDGPGPNDLSGLETLAVTAAVLSQPAEIPQAVEIPGATDPVTNVASLNGGGNGQSLATAETSSSNDAQTSLEGDATAALVSLQGERPHIGQELQSYSVGSNELPRFDVNSESQYRDQAEGNALVSASLPPTAVTEAALPTNVQNVVNSNETSNFDRIAVQIDSTSIQPSVAVPAAAVANNLEHQQKK